MVSYSVITWGWQAEGKKDKEVVQQSCHCETSGQTLTLMMEKSLENKQLYKFVC